jgi:multiple inositol-polyphosphate phosphatase/2,3-bisphosphoglycerate 3-phosphatase
MASRINRLAAFFTAIFFISINLVAALEQPAKFDVRQHISSTTSYAAGSKIKYGNEDAVITPDGCVPVHVNLVARHGSRRPTKKRIAELEKFADRLRVLYQKAVDSQSKKTTSPPAWILDWASPWSDKQIGGELLPKGEEELYDLAQRYKLMYPDIFNDQYHPDVYPIIATQVGRSAASSVAFGMGMFAGQGTLGVGKHRAFSVITDTKGHDIHLRFHDTCMAYKESKKLRKPKVAAEQKDVYDLVAKGVKGRYGLALTGDDVTSLWLLCKNEASLLDVVDQACGLFTDEEIELLEWADDLEMFHLKGYGETINYRMGIPLLDDVVQSMDRAMLADQSHKVVEKARLRFAHAETVIPFSCLLGLFLEHDDVKKVQSEEPLKAPFRPPHKRLWRAALVAPFAANTALVLHKCPANNAAGAQYLVQALHNEKPVVMPACNGTYFCPIEAFKERVVSPHMKSSFEALCTMSVVHTPPNQTFFQKFFSIPSHLFRWLFSSTSGQQGTCRSGL